VYSTIRRCVSCVCIYRSSVCRSLAFYEWFWWPRINGIWYLKADSINKYLGAYCCWRPLTSYLSLLSVHDTLYFIYRVSAIDSSQNQQQRKPFMDWPECIDSAMVNPLVQTALQGLTQLHAKKKPITVPILTDMVEDANSTPTLANLRITTISLLTLLDFWGHAYQGMWRGDNARKG